MEAAKNKISSFLGRDGQHHTEVDEHVNPAVTSETVKPHRHEETTEAVDREVHQHHYHTTVQPLSHQEVLPEKHTHNVAPQVEKTIQHGDESHDKSRIAAELGQFKDTSRTQDTTHSISAAPTVEGAHHHHHVHETVQPVIHKETIQPEVVHTTIPIHEKITAPSEHHGLSKLPVKTLEEFQTSGQSLTGGESRHTEYEGHPHRYRADLQETRAPVDINPEAHDGTHDPVKTGHFSQDSSTTGTNLPIHQSTEQGHHTGDLAAASGLGAAAVGAAGIATHSGASQHDESRHRDTSAVMGSGVAGVAAGSAAHDLARDHTTADKVRDLDPSTTTGTVGDSHSTAVGTSLGGRTEGNTVAHAETAASQGLASHESTPRNIQEPTRDCTTSHADTGLKKEISADDNVQHASLQGEDPSLETNKSSKLTGTGTDGSHSAVFGLTPDGHKFDDTTKFTTTSAPVPEEGNTSNKRDSGIGGADIGSHQADSSKVAEQMHDPRVAEKGHEGKAEYGVDDSNKPGAGVSV